MLRICRFHVGRLYETDALVAKKGGSREPIVSSSPLSFSGAPLSASLFTREGDNGDFGELSWMPPPMVEEEEERAEGRMLNKTFSISVTTAKSPKYRTFLFNKSAACRYWRNLLYLAPISPYILANPVVLLRLRHRRHQRRSSSSSSSSPPRSYTSST